MRRTLNLNTTKFWLINVIGQSDEIDNDGFKTGEVIDTYSDPIEINLSIYPANGNIVEQLFGKDVQLDKIAVSSSIDLNKDSLLFLTEPVSNFYTTYDYRVSNIKKSINVFQYGLRNRE
jgi:hypothetical protein